MSTFSNPFLTHAAGYFQWNMGQGECYVDNVFARDVYIKLIFSSLYFPKYQRIQQKLGDPSNENECREVLEEAHSTCSPSDSCTGQNTDSIQLSVDEVCESVDTDIKLLFESIQDEFDLVFTCGFERAQESSR